MFLDFLPFFFGRYFVSYTAVSVKSDQRVCLIPFTILLSFDKLKSRLSSTTVVPVIGNRGSLICPQLDDGGQSDRRSTIPRCCIKE